MFSAGSAESSDFFKRYRNLSHWVEYYTRRLHAMDEGGASDFNARDRHIFQSLVWAMPRDLLQEAPCARMAWDRLWNA